MAAGDNGNAGLLHIHTQQEDDLGAGLLRLGAVEAYSGHAKGRDNPDDVADEE
ncbi:hypothetical protein [Paraburkholderia tropica]|uniref:hypothetical protein n=1 Tax=Paraburkholderia tropica TaxID=92647 RepID=UPI001CC55842|nr:hypothetical protein [Paraburkholderia tropica]